MNGVTQRYSWWSVHHQLWKDWWYDRMLLEPVRYKPQCARGSSLDSDSAGSDVASGKTQNCGYAIYNKWLNVVLMTPKLLLGPLTPACPDLDMSQAHYHNRSGETAGCTTTMANTMTFCSTLHCNKFRWVNASEIDKISIWFKPQSSNKTPCMITISFDHETCKLWVNWL